MIYGSWGLNSRPNSHRIVRVVYTSLYVTWRLVTVGGRLNYCTCPDRLVLLFGWCGLRSTCKHFKGPDAKCYNQPVCRWTRDVRFVFNAEKQLGRTTRVHVPPPFFFWPPTASKLRSSFLKAYVYILRKYGVQYTYTPTKCKKPLEEHQNYIKVLEELCTNNTNTPLVSGADHQERKRREPARPRRKELHRH